MMNADRQCPRRTPTDFSFFERKQTMKRITLWLFALLIVFAGGVLARPLLAPATATAAPSQQGLMPVEFYVLMNQPGPLWLARINLADVYLAEADLSKANLHEANLTRANLTNTKLQNAILRSANLSDSGLRNTLLSGADLTNANLSRANMQGADLTGANLTKANLSSANLAGVDLTDAILEGAVLNESRYNNSTIWPTDFDVSKTSARKVD
jgi:hypothetical protein